MASITGNEHERLTCLAWFSRGRKLGPKTSHSAPVFSVIAHVDHCTTDRDQGLKRGFESVERLRRRPSRISIHRSFGRARRQAYLLYRAEVYPFSLGQRNCLTPSARLQVAPNIPAATKEPNASTRLPSKQPAHRGKFLFDAVPCSHPLASRRDLRVPTESVGKNQSK